MGNKPEDTASRTTPPPGGAAMWNERYGKTGFAYGTDPNEFLVSAVTAHGRAKGIALCLAEGEGRNSVYLATLGYRPLAIDQSSAGLAKVSALAAMKGMHVDTLCIDLDDYVFPANACSLVVSISAHLPPELRRRVHRGVVSALEPSGLFVLEAYHPDNLGRGTGGPPTPELLVTAGNLRDELDGLDFLHLRETEREVNEGEYHRGLAAVTQLVARKPD